MFAALTLKMAAIYLLSVGLSLMAATPETYFQHTYRLISTEYASQNLVFSPVSVQSCLALTYLGANGETAHELKTALRLQSGNKEASVQYFEKLTGESRSEDSKLKIANRVYVDQRYEIAPAFNELAQKYFAASAESVQFADAEKTANQINKFVEDKTQHKIMDLISPNSLGKDTSAVLVNAIYFKAEWVKSFDGLSTQKKDFFVSKSHKVSTDMMFQKDTFKYASLSNLDATAIELPYVHSDITMMVILPKKNDGLAELEEKLSHMELGKIAEKLKAEKVRLHLPKFKVEFEIQLRPLLEKMGMKTMFTPNADFSSLLTSKQPMAISEVKHKAIIEVNERGTEASGATYAKVYPLSLVYNEVVHDFIADHPFFFALRDKDYVYFAGHVVKF